MANWSATEMANYLAATMAELDKARVILMLAAKAESLNVDEAKQAFHQLARIADDVHNEMDLVCEGLEALS